jgi:hypothetical protein
MPIFYTEYLDFQPFPSAPTPTPTDIGDFTAPVGAPISYLTQGSVINITWDTDATHVNLSFWSEVNDPWPIFSTFSLAQQ